jgi:PadR family transcriptional regulator PadR
MFSSCSPIPQGTPDMLILRTLLLQPAHGYGIAQRIVEMSRETIRVSQGSLYPALHRLEQKGCLKSGWRPSEKGHGAKFYSLTHAGQKQLARERESWNRLTSAVELIFCEKS